MAVTINFLVGADVPARLKKLGHKIVWVVEVNGLIKHFTNDEEAFAHMKILLDIQVRKALNPPNPRATESLEFNS